MPQDQGDARAWLDDVHVRHMEHIHAYMQARLKEIHERHPDRLFAGNGGAGGRMNLDGRLYARHAYGYEDGADHVHETAIVHENHELMHFERIRLDRAARQLVFLVEVVGPDGTSGRHEWRFDTSTASR